MVKLPPLNHFLVYSLITSLLAVASFGAGRWPFYDLRKRKVFLGAFLFLLFFLVVFYQEFFPLIQWTDLFLFGFIGLTYFILGFYRKYNLGSTLYEGKSKYHHLFVRENLKENRRWMSSEKGYMAGVNLETGMPTSPYYFLSDITNPNATSALFIGGGPCAAPTYVWKNYPKMRVTVVEIDPLTIKLARKFFNLPKDKRYRVFIKEARSFLAKKKDCMTLYF